MENIINSGHDVSATGTSYVGLIEASYFELADVRNANYPNFP